MEIVNALSGDPMSVWMDKAATELGRDAVALWYLFGAGSEQFGLEGEELDNFVKTVAADFVGRGAIPVWGSALGVWLHTAEFGSSPEEIANKMVVWWHRQSPEPDLPDSPWLTNPENLPEA